MTAVAVKLVVIPLIFIPLAVLAGIRGANLLALSLAWKRRLPFRAISWRSRPARTTSSQGQLVVISSVCCIPTVFLMIFILQSLALL